jgi:hypothetical protein
VRHQIADTANRICDLQQIKHEIAHEIARVTSPFHRLWCCHLSHGRATEEGRRTGFPLLRYGCQLRASALEHSSIWRNLKCLLYIY